MNYLSSFSMIIQCRPLTLVKFFVTMKGKTATKMGRTHSDGNNCNTDYWLDLISETQKGSLITLIVVFCIQDSIVWALFFGMSDDDPENFFLLLYTYSGCGCYCKKIFLFIVCLMLGFRRVSHYKLTERMLLFPNIEGLILYRYDREWWT